MTDDADPTSKSPSATSAVTLGLTAAFLFFIVSGVLSFWNTRTLREDAQLVAQTHEVITALGDVLTSLQDAETGQRGFIITGNEHYLEPYNLALSRIDGQLNAFAALIKGKPDQESRLPEIRAHTKAKLAEMAEAVALRRNKGFEAAYAVINTDRGKNDMDALRSIINDMRRDERELRRQREAEMSQAFGVALGSGIITGLLGIFLTAAIAYLLRRAANLRERQQWLQTGMVNLGNVLVGEQRVEQLSQGILNYFVGYFGAQVGAFYVNDGRDFKRTATYGVPETSTTPDQFSEGDGLLGQAAKSMQALRVDDVPEKMLTLGSALTHGSPRYLIVAPTCTDGAANAVFELGFLQPLNPLAQELLDRASESIAIAVKSANYRRRLQELLEETQRQSEELQAQSEELRVSNEELEEQSRALKEQQVQLEHQQAELEQTNAQLEEKTQLLDAQKNDLLRSKMALESQARLVEQTSQYKSDFLANMSHELRTPLNSTLILAQLLAENREGNLTDEQTKYARTIQSAGNDLLALINDVLDLSKIEAGRMDLKPKQLSLPSLVESLRDIFEPVAHQRGLKLNAELAPGTDEFIETDAQRLEQILKNLLSNALKFTEHGSVSLEIRAEAADNIAFVVRDTGIGIEKDQQSLIFEPFCQADGTTARKYGGTGLGLSISRELARLLGGDIRLSSEVGRGSTFTLIVPRKPLLSAADSSVASMPAAASELQKEEPRKISDDRARISNAARLILLVEDDHKFAQVLADIAHDQNFECLIASSANEALRLAQEHQPRAVLLDISLPDNSGLFVLEKLKRDARTRHLPVHVISGTDYSEKALSMGAVGYLLKPVEHNRLVEAFQQLEARLSQRLRRVLVVEDDATQLEALRSLLSSRDVVTVGAGNASECLDLLKGDTFDCMVLDLSLPDASGFALLEKVSTDDQYAFPPVIVYTGRELSPDEEQRLRRYSKSIIIKGAKSPERLLDEVTLFLHQVVSELPPEQQKMLDKVRSRDAALEGRRVLIAEDDVRNIFALTSLLEPLGLTLELARNGKEAIEALDKSRADSKPIDLVLMDIMMPEMDGLTATREIRRRPEWGSLPIIALTAKAMRNDQEKCLEAGASDYLPKPLDVDKLLSLIRVWMPR
jgi:CheY-like chemotaxis protein/CHASE3 domain sensor protein